MAEGSFQVQLRWWGFIDDADGDVHFHMRQAAEALGAEGWRGALKIMEGVWSFEMHKDPDKVILAEAGDYVVAVGSLIETISEEEFNNRYRQVE